VTRTIFVRGPHNGRQCDPTTVTAPVPGPSPETGARTRRAPDSAGTSGCSRGQTAASAGESRPRRILVPRRRPVRRRGRATGFAERAQRHRRTLDQARVDHPERGDQQAENAKLVVRGHDPRRGPGPPRLAQASWRSRDSRPRSVVAGDVRTVVGAEPDRRPRGHLAARLQGRREAPGAGVTAELKPASTFISACASDRAEDFCRAGRSARSTVAGRVNAVHRRGGRRRPRPRCSRSGRCQALPERSRHDRQARPGRGRALAFVRIVERKGSRDLLIGTQGVYPGNPFAARHGGQGVS